MRAGDEFLKTFLGESFLEELKKSNELFKLGTQTALDPEEIRIGLKVVPRAVMSFLINELVPMEVGTQKEIQLPFGDRAVLNVNKGDKDSYSGSIINALKPAYDFRNRSIPGIGIILLSTFELYDMADFEKEHKHEPSAEEAVQKLIDQRLQERDLIEKVIDQKLSQREAVHRLIMQKLTEALEEEKKKNTKISDVTNIATSPGNHSNEYHRGMANGLVVANSIANDKPPNFIDPPTPISKPLELNPQDIVKKEKTSKGSPLKQFLERKKPKEFNIKMEKSEVVNCPDCQQVIFGETGYSGCVCMGENMDSQIWLKKTETGVKISFSRQWAPENLEMLLKILMRKDG